MNKINLLIIGSVFLTGCSIFSKPEPILETRYVERPLLNISSPSPVKPLPVEFIIITESNVEEVWQRLRDKKVDVVLFGLTDKGYENISVNFAELKRYLLEQKQIIQKYKEYYETPLTNQFDD